jgi:hypothetical protein
VLLLCDCCGARCTALGRPQRCSPPARPPPGPWLHSWQGPAAPPTATIPAGHKTTRLAGLQPPHRPPLPPILQAAAFVAWPCALSHLFCQPSPERGGLWLFMWRRSVCRHCACCRRGSGAEGNNPFSRRALRAGPGHGRAEPLDAGPLSDCALHTRCLPTNAVRLRGAASVHAAPGRGGAHRGAPHSPQGACEAAPECEVPRRAL